MLTIITLQKSKERLYWNVTKLCRFFSRQKGQNPTLQKVYVQKMS